MFIFLHNHSSLWTCNSLKRSILHNYPASITLRNQHKDLCPRVLLSYQQSSSSSTPTSHSGLLTTRFVSRTEMKAFVSLCLTSPWSFAHRIRIHFSKANKNSHWKAHGCHPEPMISINYSPFHTSVQISWTILLLFTSLFQQQTSPAIAPCGASGRVPDEPPGEAAARVPAGGAALHHCWFYLSISFIISGCTWWYDNTMHESLH